MRPKNMPERRNARRKAALSRLGSRRTDTPERRAALDVETLALHGRVVPSVREIRTKKYRGAERRPAAIAL